MHSPDTAPLRGPLGPLCDNYVLDIEYNFMIYYSMVKIIPKL